jgi:hypothetical protein
VGKFTDLCISLRLCDFARKKEQETRSKAAKGYFLCGSPSLLPVSQHCGEIYFFLFARKNKDARK